MSTTPIARFVKSGVNDQKFFLQSLFSDVLATVGVKISPPQLVLERPEDTTHGDYATPVALMTAKKIGKKPMELANVIVKEMEKRLKGNSGSTSESIGRIEAVPPGFINIWVLQESLIWELQRVLESASGGVNANPGGPKIMVEFAHPNTHKEFHIGHLRNIAIGESVVRTLQANDAEVFRANYEGDVGLHVAKAIWGSYQKMKPKTEKRKAKFSRHDKDALLKQLEDETNNMSPSQKAKFLGEGYALGSKAYEEDEAAKKEIIESNKAMYKDPQAVPLWKETRQMSLDYFDSVYKRLGTHFDRLFFESEVEERGRQLVIDGVEKGIFIKDADGSIYFPGENVGLNNCVFVTREGYATYEGKDVALEQLEYETFPFDLDIHVVASEQINFFQIAFAALEQLFPHQKGRQYHLTYGMVKLKSGKMSSRTGQVITADGLIDEAKKKIREIIQLSNEERDEIEHIAETVAVAAVKYAMLRVSPKQDIAFDLSESVSLDGDSGPYLLYTYARCKSVMRKGQRDKGTKGQSNSGALNLWNFEPNEEESLLLRTLHRFPEVVYEAAKHLSPNLICSYLFTLSQAYNGFYNKHQILQSSVISSQLSVVSKKKPTTENRPLKTDNRQPTTEFRLFLTEATAVTIKKGLYLLGIETVEKM